MARPLRQDIVSAMGISETADAASRRTSRVAKTASLVVSLLLVASACGGSTSSLSGSTSTPGTRVSETTIAESVDAEQYPGVDDAQLAVVAIVAAHGDEGAFRAVIWALERGYSGDQLIAGALEARLQADGVITAARGGPEAPDRSPLGLVALPNSDLESAGIIAIHVGYLPGSPRVVSFNSQTIEEIQRELRIERAEATLLIITGIFSGYSGPQIIQAVIERSTWGRIEDETRDIEFECMYIRDGTGRVVVPELAARADPNQPWNRRGCYDDIRKLADEEEQLAREVGGGELEGGQGGGVEGSGQSDLSGLPEHVRGSCEEKVRAGICPFSKCRPPLPWCHPWYWESQTFPWTFEGTGTRTLTASTNFGIKGSDTVSSTIEIVIVLEADGEGSFESSFEGKASGTFTFHKELVYDCTQEEGRHGNVYARDREQEVVLEGRHTWNSDRKAGSFTLLPDTTVELTGTYRIDAISGFQTQQYTIPAKDECDGTREDRRDLEFKDVPRKR